MLHPLRAILEEIVLQGLTDFKKHVSINPWMMEYLVKSISAIVERQSADSKDPREEYFGCPRPDYSKLVGYGAKFHTPRSTKEWMNELREGEEE